MSATTSICRRLAGKSVLFHGRFDWDAGKIRETARTYGARLAEVMKASLDYLVVPDLSGGKTIQNKALAFNRKGAQIQVLDVDDFKKLLVPTVREVLGLIQEGAATLFNEALELKRFQVYGPSNLQPFSFVAEKFDGLKLKGFDFTPVGFEQCTFIGTLLAGTEFGLARGCDFSGCEGGGTRVNEYEDCSVKFEDVKGSRFRGARLKYANFAGNIVGADFTSAVLDGAEFFMYGARRKKDNPPVFARASLREAEFNAVKISSAVFRDADLTGATFHECTLEQCDFRNAMLRNVMLAGTNLAKADFRGADLRGANLCEADLQGVSFDGADLAGCNLLGAKLTGAKLTKAKNLAQQSMAAGTPGPALKELDKAAKRARRIKFKFRVLIGKDSQGEEVEIDTANLKQGWGLHLPPSCRTGWHWNNTGATVSSAMLRAAHHIGDHRVRFETLDISTTKSAKSSRELRGVVLRAIAEAFGQTPPGEAELAAAAATYRHELQKKQREKKRRHTQSQNLAAARAASKRARSLKEFASKTGRVSDIATFLTALQVRADKAKLQKATSMLKASGFQLFNDVTPDLLTGVVKSQTDPDLVYACRLQKDGKYACCTQNLNICGGLRGSICKHLLVLIIGLIQAGQLDPATIDGWIAHTHGIKPELDKERMGEIFIKYKGAEAGEVDWRPTETMPEDYYAL